MHLCIESCINKQNSSKFSIPARSSVRIYYSSGFFTAFFVRERGTEKGLEEENSKQKWQNLKLYTCLSRRRQSLWISFANGNKKEQKFFVYPLVFFLCDCVIGPLGLSIHRSHVAVSGVLARSPANWQHCSAALHNTIASTLIQSDSLYTCLMIFAYDLDTTWQNMAKHSVGTSVSHLILASKCVDEDSETNSNSELVEVLHVLLPNILDMSFDACNAEMHTESVLNWHP